MSKVIYHSIVSSVFDSLSPTIRDEIEGTIGQCELRKSNDPMPPNCFDMDVIAPGAIQIRIQLATQAWVIAAFVGVTDGAAIFHAFLTFSDSLVWDEVEFDKAQNQLQDILDNHGIRLRQKS